MDVFSWLRRISGPSLGGRLSGLRSALARPFVGDGLAPFPREDEPVKVKATQPSTQPDGELTVASIAKWLEEMAKVESSIAEANISVGKQMASIQAAIIFAQDNLSENDEVGRLALKKKIDCADKFHQQVCQFDKVVCDVMRVAALMPQLARIIDGPRRQNLTYVIDPIAAHAAVDLTRERSWIKKQLTRIERDLAQLETSAEVSASQVSVCVAGMETVVRLLTRQIDEIVSELGHLVTVIAELDRFIVAA